jgi:hypothetical protein
MTHVPQLQKPLELRPG